MSEEKEENPIPHLLEALLFSSGRTMELEELEQLTGFKTKELRKAINELKNDYAERDSSLMIVEEKEGWKLTVKERFLEYVQKIVTETEMSKTVMETLAVIAFKHPCLQAEVIKIRTNKAYEHLKELEETGFITKSKSGRTYKLHLTQKFFNYFDLPKEKVKEVFASFEAVEKAIMEKETEAQHLRDAIEKNEPVESYGEKKKEYPKMTVVDMEEGEEGPVEEEKEEKGEEKEEAAKEPTEEEFGDMEIPEKEIDKHVEAMMHGEEKEPKKEEEEPKDILTAAHEEKEEEQ